MLVHGLHGLSTYLPSPFWPLKAGGGGGGQGFGRGVDSISEYGCW